MPAVRSAGRSGTRTAPTSTRVRFLLDQNQSLRLIESLAAHGHETQHVRDLGMRASSDVDILEAARRSGHVIISGDTDFGELLAASDATGPSVVLIRRRGQRRAHQIAALLLANLDILTDELETGAIVVFDADRIAFDGSRSIRTEVTTKRGHHSCLVKPSSRA